MTQNEARTIIYQAFIDGWDPTAPAVPYTFENEEFDAIKLAEWVEVSVKHASGGQWTLGPKGNRIYRRRGAVVIELYSAVDRGLLRLDELGTAARNIYEGETLSQVCFNDGNYFELKPDGQWARSLVSVLFSYDETK